MDQFIEGCFSWPSLPATVLLLLVCGYWCLVILGALDMDILDFDLDIDLDADVDASILQVGFIPAEVAEHRQRANDVVAERVFFDGMDGFTADEQPDVSREP